MNNRDIFILEKISQYCYEISTTIEKMDLDYAKFHDDFIARNAITMCILTIGKLATKLTDEFKENNAEIKWKSIVGIRNRAAHGYWDMNTEIIWQVATENIPELKAYCENIFEE